MSNNEDSDDDERRMTMAPAINIVSDGKEVTGADSERGRRKSRRGSIGLRRDSRSGAREVSPAAFLQYQNNMNLSDMSAMMSLGKNSPKNSTRKKSPSGLRLAPINK